MTGLRSTWRAKAPLVKLALAALLSLWVFGQSARLFLADWASARERRDIVDWVGGAAKPESPQSWEEARAAIASSLSFTPDDPDLLDRMGDLYTVAGQRDWAVADLRRAHFREAARFYRSALDRRPTEATTWAMLAAARQAAGEDGARVHEAWSRALALGPYEATVQPVLMQVALADWPGATPAMHNWANRLFDLGNEATRRDINALALRYGLRFVPDAVVPPP